MENNTTQMKMENDQSVLTESNSTTEEHGEEKGEEDDANDREDCELCGGVYSYKKDYYCPTCYKKVQCCNYYKHSYYVKDCERYDKYELKTSIKECSKCKKEVCKDCQKECDQCDWCEWHHVVYCGHCLEYHQEWD